MNEQDHITDQITNRLAQDARAKEARMLPNQGPLNPAQIDHVRDALAEYLGEANARLPEVARSIGCAPQALLHFMDRKHRGPLDDFARKIYRWVLNRRRTGDAGMPTELVKTGLTDRILGIIHQTVQLGSMSAIVGPSGVGKTTVFKAVAAGIIPGARHIELSSVDSSRTGLIYRIASELGGPSRHRMQQSFEWIIGNLPPGSLMLLDEVHYLSEGALNTVRDIHKRSGCPVVLGGTQDVLTTINDFNAFHGQFKRLVSNVYNITEEMVNSGGSLYTLEEVISYATEMGIRLTIDGADECTKLANVPGWGGLGALSYLLINANMLATMEAEAKGGSTKNLHVHPRHVNSALRQMEGSSGFDRVKLKMTQPERKARTA